MLKPLLSLSLVALFAVACAKKSQPTEMAEQDASGSPRLMIANYMAEKLKKDKPFLFYSQVELGLIRKKQTKLAAALEKPEVPHSLFIYGFKRSLSEDTQDLDSVLAEKVAAAKAGAAIAKEDLAKKSSELTEDFTNKAQYLASLGAPASNWPADKLSALMEITTQAVMDVEVLQALPPSKAQKEILLQVKPLVKKMIKPFKAAQEALENQKS